MDLDLVPPLDHPPRRLEQVVRAQIDAGARLLGREHARARALLLALRPVRLHPERVHREHERAAAVVEGIQEDLDVVVPEDPVAIGQRRVDGAVGLAGPDSEVQPVGCVPNEDFGLVVGG